jgi:hypothetical protein
MSILTGSADVRQPLDWAMIGLAALVLLVAVVLGMFALGVGFVTTIAYEHEWQWISFVCGLICAGCVAYLLLEYTGPKAERAVLFAIAAGGIFGYLAVSNGVPAGMTAIYGKPGAEVFVMDDLTFGSKGCRGTVIAHNERYSEMRICINYFGNRPPHIGGKIELRGKISAWGMTRESYRAI